LEIERGRQKISQKDEKGINRKEESSANFCFFVFLE
jgi:hypothetical protein